MSDMPYGVNAENVSSGTQSTMTITSHKDSNNNYIIPDSVAKGLIIIGIGIAVAGGFYAGSTIVKDYEGFLFVKLCIVFVSAMMGGGAILITKIIDKRINKDK